MHGRDLLKAGVTVDKLVLVSGWREAGALFTDQEKAALRWTETVTQVTQTYVPDEEFEAVRAHFSEKEVADLTIAIGLMNAYNRIGVGFRLVPAAAK
jgi:alkylhydroperoxidase family enzyme